MAEKTASTFGLSLGKLALAGLIGLTALAVLGGIAFAAFQFINYGDSATERAAFPTARVVIVSPGHGKRFVAGEGIPVEVSSTGAEAFQRSELWLNGELMSVQSDQEQQSASWTTHFLWIPAEPGAYQLVARSYSGESATASRGTLILVDPVDITGEAFEDVPVNAGGPRVLPAMESEGLGGGAPAVDPPAGEGEEWAPRPGVWVASLTSDQPPAPPTIQAEVDGCQVTLWIQDLSENEEGFLVRRQSVASQATEEVASLAAMPGEDSFEFNHLTEAGSYSYSVRAFNSQGSSDSNPAIAEVNPADCSESSDAELVASYVSVEMSNFQTSAPVERAYCYRSFDGTNWERWPLQGFFPVDEGVMEGGEFNVLLEELGAGGPLETMGLFVECWGWNGQELTFLGASSQGLGEPGENTLAAGLFSFDVVQELGATPAGNPYFPLSDDGDMLAAVPHTDFSIDEKQLYTVKMLQPVALATSDPEACKDRLPPDLQNDLGKVLGCFPFPGFNVGPGGENPQPYLIWFPGERCIAGFGIPPCTSYSSWLEQADKVGFEVWDSAQASYEIFDTPNLFVYNIKPFACEGSRSFQVRMWAQIDDFTVTGNWSSPVTIPCPIPDQGVAQVWVTFAEVNMISVEDGESEPQDVEVYGVFKAWTSVDKLEIWLGRQSDWPSECPSEAFSGTLNRQGFRGLGCREDMDVGTHSIAQMATCEAPCPSNWYDTRNNRGFLLVPDGEEIQFMYNLMDYDTGSANDQVCFHSAGTERRSYFEWLDEESAFDMGGLFDWPNGRCQVRIELNGLNAPPAPLPEQ